LQWREGAPPKGWEESGEPRARSPSPINYGTCANYVSSERECDSGEKKPVEHPIKLEVDIKWGRNKEKIFEKKNFNDNGSQVPTAPWEEGLKCGEARNRPTVTSRGRGRNLGE